MNTLEQLEKTYEYDWSQLTTSVLNVSSLDIASDGWKLGVFLFGVLLFFTLYISLPYLYGYLKIHKQKKEQAHKKDKIQELILMKDIQNELEKELEEKLLQMSIASNLHLPA